MKGSLWEGERISGLGQNQQIDPARLRDSLSGLPSSSKQACIAPACLCLTFCECSVAMQALSRAFHSIAGALSRVSSSKSLMSLFGVFASLTTPDSCLCIRSSQFPTSHSLFLPFPFQIISRHERGPSACLMCMNTCVLTLSVIYRLCTCKPAR